MTDIARTRYRYLALSLLFGSAFGVRYTLDLWIYARLGGGASARFVLVAASLLAMLIGDLGAAQVAARAGYRRAIALASLGLLGWCAFTGIAVFTHKPDLMFGSAIAFGLALGAYHSCVDAWFDYRHRRFYNKAADDSDLSLGYWLYNSGYLLGAVAAFPLLIQRPLSTVVEDVTATNLGVMPSVLVFVIAAAIFYLRPEESHPTLTEARRSVQGYGAVIRSGGGAFILAVLVGAGVSVLIQFIDHFAPSLIKHTTLLMQAADIAIINGIVCAGMGVSVWLVSRSDGPLSARRRSLVIVCGLCVAIASIAYVRSANAGSVVIATLLGVVQGVLVSLPPLLKAQVLQSIPQSSHNAIALSILGASKRLAAIPVALIAIGINPGGSTESAESTVYLVLLAIAVIAAIGTAAWGAFGTSPALTAAPEK